jgi:hypothetical protein
LDKIHADIIVSLKDPELRDRIAAQGVEIVGSTQPCFRSSFAASSRNGRTPSASRAPVSIELVVLAGKVSRITTQTAFALKREVVEKSWEAVGGRWPQWPVTEVAGAIRDPG